MPKKKLTKAQVKRKFKSLFLNVTDLALDKAYYPQGFTPMSRDALMKISDTLARAFNRMK
jgi:hypothetical protein